jgi:hypothetical protein
MARMSLARVSRRQLLGASSAALSLTGPTGDGAPVSAPPQPQPQPKPTPADTAVKVVTSVTQQVPAPVGPFATQAVQAAGSAADGVLGSGGTQPPSVLP